MIPTHGLPADQLASFAILADRLLMCEGDRFMLPGGIECLIDNGLPSGVALFVRSARGYRGQHDDQADALSYSGMLKP